MKSRLSPATVTVAAVLLSIMLRNDPALAADGCPAPSFAPARTFEASPGCSVSVAVGDFNGDGKADLVLGTQDPFDCCTEVVTVLLGNGDGTFQAGAAYPAGLNPAFVAIGDFNGDGRPDLVTGSESGTNVLSVLLGNGNGTFQPAASFGARWGPDSLAAADLRGDGNLDIAAASSGTYDPGSGGYTNGRVEVLLGNGDGTFQAPAGYGAGRIPYSVAVGDLNGDGRPDLAVANLGDGPAFTNGSVSVLLGNGDGTLKPAVSYVTGPGPSSVATGDFNGDGKLDIIVANYGSGPGFTNGSVSVLLGNGDGSFRAAIGTSIVPSPVSVAVADFNGDGYLDVVVSHDSYGSGTAATVSVMLGNGDGTFQAPVSFGTGAFLRDSDRSLAVGDFNGDGKPDVAVAVCGGAALLLNTCPNAGLRLAVARTSNILVLSWPLPYTNFVLEATANLGSPSWEPAVASLTTNGGKREVPVPFDREQRYFRLRKPGLGTALFAQSLVTADSNGDGATALAVTNGYITALLRSECTSAPSPPPPVGKIAVGPDYVIMTVAAGDPLDYLAAQQLVTDAIFESLMPSYCALARHSGISCVTNQVQWGIETYDAGGNPKVSGCAASGCGLHYCAVTSGYITAVLRGEGASLPPPPPVGVIAVGTDSVIMTMAEGDPLDLGAARQLATDAVFEPLMRTYCALPRGSGIGFSSGRVQWNVATYDATGIPKLSGCATSGCDFHSCVVTNGYITALLRSECTSAPSPPPPVGKIAVGPDYVIMTVADGDPLDYRAAQQLVTDAIFESLMPLYCGLPHGTRIGCVTNRVQWGIETYDAGGNPKTSGCAASGCGFHYCAVTSGYITAVLRGENASLPPPPPVGVIAVGTDSVIMTLADGDPLDLSAAQQLATDSVFESLMRTYCALPRGSGIGYSSGRVQWNVATYDASGNPKLSSCATNGCEFHSCVVAKGYITALLRSDCTSAPAPPPVGGILVGPDYVIMTVADGDPFDYQAAQQLATDAVFASLMPLYCALPRHSGIGCVSDRVQWNLETYDAGGNPKVSGSPASGAGFHYVGSCSVTPQERIQNLMVWVNVDAAAGILSNGNSLTTKLGAALANLGGANTQAAINELKAFLNEVDTMVKTGRLPAAASQPLIDGAEAIITNLGGQPLRAR